MNAAIYREELDKLEADRLAGTVDSHSYEQTHAEMRQRLFQDTDEADDHAVLGSPKKTIIGICLLWQYSRRVSISILVMLLRLPRRVLRNR